MPLPLTAGLIVLAVIVVVGLAARAIDRTVDRS